MELRRYQINAIASLWQYWRDTPAGIPLIVAPTGSGKSLIIADICRRVMEAKPHYKVLIVSHRKEIIEQNAAEISKLLDKPVGIFSAGLGHRNFRTITCANIQSIYKRDVECKLLIIDECHLFSGKDDSMYGQLLKRVAPCNVLGLTATPFRVDQGSLIGGFFSDVVYDISIRELIDQNYLTPAISKPSIAKVDFSDVARSGYDYNQGQMERKMDPLTEVHCKEIIAATIDRKHILVFASGIDHAKHVSEALNSMGMLSDYVTGEMMPFSRDKKLADFKSGVTRCLVNCEILTTGFNFPKLDCIVLLRATKSCSLYVQIVGRGMRIAEGKANCLVLDFGQNIERHGPIDCVEVKRKGDRTLIGIAPIKECPNCGTISALATAICALCGYEFPPPEPVPLDEAPTEAPVVSTVEELQITRVDYFVHNKEGKPPSMRVKYSLGLSGSASQFICFQHGGYATTKAIQWWKQTFNADEYEAENPTAPHLPSPETTLEALTLIRYLKKPVRMKAIRKKFWEIIRIEHETEPRPVYKVEENPYNL